MSSRADIIDGREAAKARSGLIYTCQCGWIDLGHARPDGAARLWVDIQQQSGPKSKDGKGYKLSYSQSMSRFGLTRDVSKDFYVDLSLNLEQRRSVALAIFLEVSMAFERLQASFPYAAFTDSGFSCEDLVSNLVGFYRAVKPQGSIVDYIEICEPVSLEAARKVWDTFGAVGLNKNNAAGPFVYPCSECGESWACPACSMWPSELSVIKPAAKGTGFRDWVPATD
jgi:hypothetical protein